MTCSNTDTDTATPRSTRDETVRPYARSANGESAIAVAPTRRQPCRSPYRVPRPAVISFSGGRTSGYMLRRIVDAFGGALPSDIAVVFANTGRERPETLDFVDICGRAFGVEIAWVEYCWDSPHRTRVVDHATASRSGEPYAALIERKGFVPNPTLRACTTFLKRDRIEAFARHRLGLRRWHSVIGLRADEPRRVHRMRARNCGSRTGARAVLPLADAGIREADVLAWWKSQPFDLGLGAYQGNCDLCFLKGRAKLIRIIRDDPSLADWWIEQEASVAHRTGPDGRHCESLKRFRLEETYAELRTAALAHRDLFDDPAAVTPADEADLGDCLCTD